jgi:hypothetical protein
MLALNLLSASHVANNTEEDIGGCLSGSGPWEPDDTRAEAGPDPKRKSP